MSKGDSRFILITGIDGSGKTTVAKILTKQISKNGLDYCYVHANEVPILMRLVKICVKFVFMRKHDPFMDYEPYVKQKEVLSSQHPFLSALYRILLAIDYAPQVVWKICVPLALGKRLVVDRYIYDVVINLGLNLNYSFDQYRKDISLFFRIFPIPDMSIFLDTDEHTAFSRKDDVPSIDYLKERRSLYLYLAEIDRISVIKGKGTPEQIAREIEVELHAL
ncbi:MAG TPA: hypothetical protein VMW42_12970 [Desulfatiglandales bacterium]|nr:hypothetical protein [Desulfatiglandales bacterium]